MVWIRKDIFFLTTIVLNYHLIPFSQAWCLRFGRSPRERLIQLMLFFCHFVLLQLYTHYVGNFDKATETLASWIKKSPTMAAVIEEIQVRYEIFNWVSKIMLDSFTFVFWFSSVICPENLRRFLNQSDSKLKPTATWSPAFSCALLFEFSLAHGVIFFAMAGCCDCFGYSFTTLKRKALWHINVHETIFIYYFVA